LALTSPTGGGRSVGIVRSRTKATEFSLVYIYIILHFIIVCCGLLTTLWAYQSAMLNCRMIREERGFWLNFKY